MQSCQSQPFHPDVHFWHVLSGSRFFLSDPGGQRLPVCQSVPDGEVQVKNFRTVGSCQDRSPLEVSKPSSQQVAGSMSAHARHCRRHNKSALTDGIDLIDKDDTPSRILLRFLKQVTDTRDAPTPTNISTNSEPDRRRTALVPLLLLLLPEGVYPCRFPEDRKAGAPFQGLAPMVVYFPGLCRNQQLPEVILSRFILSLPHP